jgi:hypothetical protein
VQAQSPFLPRNKRTALSGDIPAARLSSRTMHLRHQ